MLTGPGPPDSGAIADVVMEFDADEAVDVPSELVAVTVKNLKHRANYKSGIIEMSFSYLNRVFSRKLVVNVLF